MKDEIFSDSILSDMYKARTDNFYYKIVEKYGECESENEEEQLRDKLVELIGENIDSEEIVEQIIDILDDLESAYKVTNDWWGEKYYKAGVVDGMAFDYETKDFKKLLSK